MNEIVLRNIHVEPCPCDRVNLSMNVDCLGKSASAVRKLLEKYWDEELLSQKLFDILAGDFPKVERVIFNNQATIAFWDDGEKTVVKCHECGDGQCLFDNDVEFFLSSDNTVVINDISQVENAVESIARCSYCQTHFDKEKAVMAAMLKRLYPNYQNALREALEDDDD